MRADAIRNRDKLLTAATELFDEQGTDAPLEAVARRACVGIGTLYRHFPTREALIEAAYRAEVDHLCDAALDLLVTHPPEEALGLWMERYIDYTAAKRMLGQPLHAVAAGTDLFAQTRAQILGAIEPLLAAGVAAGTLRSDVDAADVLAAMSAVWQTADAEQARRLLRLVLDGLRHVGH
jgi:AcrR family transcriptional regulator